MKKKIIKKDYLKKQKKIKKTLDCFGVNPFGKGKISTQDPISEILKGMDYLPD